MALMNCPECGGQVSDKADTCPHCGFEIKKTVLNEEQKKVDVININETMQEELDNIKNVDKKETKEYKLWSSFGINFLHRQCTYVEINGTGINVSQKRKQTNIGFDKISEIRPSLYISPLYIVAMLLIMVVCAIGISNWDFGSELLIAIIATMIVLFLIGKNQKIEILYNNGCKLFIFVASKKIAKTFLNNIKSISKCKVQRRICIWQVTCIIIIFILFGFNTYLNFFSPAKINIECVKSSYNSNYPGKTYGEAFNDFFSEPKWKGFKSETGEYTVEFNGKCLMNGTTKKVTIQYTIKDDSFNLTYYGIDGKVGSESDYQELMESVFNGKTISQSAAKETETSTVKSTVGVANNQTTKDELITAFSKEYNKASSLASMGKEGFKDLKDSIKIVVTNDVSINSLKIGDTFATLDFAIPYTSTGDRYDDYFWKGKLMKTDVVNKYKVILDNGTIFGYLSVTNSSIIVTESSYSGTYN
ncbi:zinc ribbon domain-containing protein [[Clostridium] fimetarium]|uniref:Zinc-ribbon domain-containing protein n=1 Tax=[Clostridium] fimetarium TaxID=99656 RepID=A0A1I0Q089_9FIRM|nr:zinc ribbon domain-containing protein [[Clostridium] fimetarium]SEW20269.1 hypothetical protein SAMN05421659_106185 [[Clostridium] fimetarium]